MCLKNYIREYILYCTTNLYSDYLSTETRIKLFFSSHQLKVRVKLSDMFKNKKLIILYQ